MERIGIHESFLDVGGESLLALRIINRLRSLLAENIPLSVIFEAPTIALLAEALQKGFPEAVARTGSPAAEGANSNGVQPAANLRPTAIPRLSRGAHRVPPSALKPAE